MKERALIIFLVLIAAASIFFTYQRSFVWKNFDLINSEEEGEEEITNEADSEEAEPASDEAVMEENSAGIDSSDTVYPQ
jgi:hypothetical protein